MNPFNQRCFANSVADFLEFKKCHVTGFVKSTFVSKIPRRRKTKGAYFTENAP